MLAICVLVRHSQNSGTEFRMPGPVEYHCDVLVVGSGAAGLATAVTAAHHHQNVLVVEKEPVFGGTTARSGGWIWVPGNDHARKVGIVDDLEKGRTYLRHEADEHFDESRVGAFLENAPLALRFYEQNTRLKFDLGPTFSDYHPDAPGGMPGGRSLVARPFDGRELGPEVHRLRPPLKEVTFLGMMIGSGKELSHFFNVGKSPISTFYVGRLLMRYATDMLMHGRPMRLMNGNALVARLAKSCFEMSVPIWTRSPVEKLVKDTDGRVTGAIVETPKGVVKVLARNGVMLAAGGFPQDRVRRKKLFPHAPSGNEHASPAPPGNTGDGLRLGEAAGGKVDETLPHAAAWVPISRPLNPDGTLGTFPHFVDRSKPGVIAVTRSGQRFVNEANSYHDFCQAMYNRCLQESGEVCAFFIADYRTFRKYGLGYAKPWPVPYKKQIRSGYLLTGSTIAELAHEIGADPAELERTISAFNPTARAGQDPQFGRGSTAYNVSLGDPQHQPNPCVAPIEVPPYFAVKVVIGDLGTFAGLRCDANARVLDEAGKPIPGLYAAGNDSLSIMGGNYPGGGITLGPAITFGYIAARHMSGANSV
jgi:succinate dehydrogenase/fumarate reductase flavoprotein subunit